MLPGTPPVTEQPLNQTITSDPMQTLIMKPAFSNRRAFSIVEVLVAVAVLSISLVATVAIIRKGTDIQVSVQHRQAARMILTSRLEERYGTGTYNTFSKNDDMTETVPIDPRSGDTLKGTLVTTIDSIAVSPDGTISIPVKTVMLTLSWQETPDYSDSLTITRWVIE